MVGAHVPGGLRGEEGFSFFARGRGLFCRGLSGKSQHDRQTQKLKSKQAEFLILEVNQQWKNTQPSEHVRIVLFALLLRIDYIVRTLPSRVPLCSPVGELCGDAGAGAAREAHQHR